MKDGFVLETDVPGVPLEGLKIETHGKFLQISGESGSKREEKDDAGHVILSERKSGRFFRQICLPENADLDKTTASFDHGVLRINIGKRTQAHPNVRSIPITNSSKP